MPWGGLGIQIHRLSNLCSFSFGDISTFPFCTSVLSSVSAWIFLHLNTQQLFQDSPLNCPNGSLQARILEQVAMLFSRGSSWPRERTWVSCIAGGFFTTWAAWGAPRRAHRQQFEKFPPRIWGTISHLQSATDCHAPFPKSCFQISSLLPSWTVTPAAPVHLRLSPTSREPAHKMLISS